MPLEKLLKGFRRFRSSYFEKTKLYDDLLQGGQAPDTLVIACSDSRNDPALLTQSKPGDIFVVRNVAAIVPPYQPDDNYHGTSAAIEFAVKGLKVKNIVVLGHSSCGGVQALSDQKESRTKGFEFLSQWINIGAEAKKTVDALLSKAPRAVKQQALEQAIILTSLNNLMTFPWIKAAAAAGEITLHGWYFDMQNGKMLGYDFINGRFVEVQKQAEGFSKPLPLLEACCDHWSLETLVKKYA